MSLSNSYIFQLGASGSEVTVPGQLDGTMSPLGGPVETTNKANGGAVTYYPDFVAGKGFEFNVTFTSTDESALNEMKAAASSGAQLAGKILSGVGAESWQCDTWVFDGRSDAAPVNAVTQVSLTIKSSGPVTEVAAS